MPLASAVTITSGRSGAANPAIRRPISDITAASTRWLMKLSTLTMSPVTLARSDM